MRQLFDTDAQLFDLSALSDLILSQPLLGSTVKTDGNESDPFAFLTILNLQEHKDKPAIKPLIDYILQQTSQNSALNVVNQVLQGDNTVGLILTERFMNMPVEVVPPMYKMLLEEMTWANEEKEPYTFTHYLIISKTYREIESQLDQEDNRPQKKKKKGLDKAEVFNFHPEDGIIQRFALAYGDYPYIKEGADGDADSKRTFQEHGIKPQGHMILLEASKYESMVTNLEQALQPLTGAG
jgi:protein BCP1